VSLHALLASFAGRRQFILYRLQPRGDATGKLDKIPVHPQTGHDHDAHDSSTWLTAEEAAAYATVGWLIGIVIYEGCGLFCIDLDGQLDAKLQWSPMAQDICARFPGAAMELSTSGKGLHIFGSCAADFPKHRVTRAGSGLEVYTRHRFIALTGTGFQGDARGDHTAALHAVIGMYLPEAIGMREADWTVGPYPGWRGGGTDDQILAGLRNRAGAHAVFGDGASFPDLFEANTDALQRAFPDPTGKSLYNASAADQALANHLAWATGYDCERTRALMFRSALARSKWERDDYIRRTIIAAVAGKIPLTPGGAEAAADIPVIGLQESAAAEAPRHAVRPIIPVAPGALPGNLAPGHYVTAAEQAALFDGCVYVRDVHQILMPDGAMIASGPFNAHFGGLTFQMTADGTKPTKEAWQAFLFSEIAHFPRTDSVIFSPKLASGELIYRDGQKLLNTWKPLYIDMREGDVSLFLRHLEKLYPVGRDAEILVSYMAACVQYQGEKFKWAPLLQGVEGNGKTFFSKCVEYAIGQRYTHWPRADKMDKQFNAAFYGKLLICVEDVRISEARESLWETLKPMITGEQIEIEPKGVDSKVARDVCFNFMLNSNHRNAIRKTENDRRIASLFGAQQIKTHLARDGLTDEYFITLYSWANREGYAHVAHYLATLKIADELNPAKGMIRAPDTSSTHAAIHAGRGVVEQEIAEAVAEGRKGFRNGWLNSIAFDNLLAEIGKQRVVSRNARHDMLEALGYRLHPKLLQGRVALPDGTVPKLYLTTTHHISEMPEWSTADVVRLYLEAQVAQ
jgi:hypothetical protein